MNKTVSPCEDFYNYACGGWESNYPPPNNEDIWNLDKMTERNAILEIKGEMMEVIFYKEVFHFIHRTNFLFNIHLEILEEEEGNDDLAPLKYEKLWYKSCMDLGINNISLFLILWKYVI